MGVNWDSGLIYWKDHTPSTTERHSLSHLHPFIQTIELETTAEYPGRTVLLHVSFGLHAFTRRAQPHDADGELYRDNREVRTFDHERYTRSFELPNIFRTLDARRCSFARGTSGRINYVTVQMVAGERYAAFFDLRRFKKVGPNAVHLMVQSAYVLEARKPEPGRGRIHFHALLGHVLRGTAPRPPP